MIETTNHSEFDLEKGTCTSCSEKSDEILKDDGRCIDCVEAQKFEDMTMQGL